MTLSLINATAVSCPSLAGYSFVPIDSDRLAEFTAEAEADHITYTFGGKDPNVGSGEIDFPRGIDCSGWFRTLADYISHNLLTKAGLPDGSYTQGHWLITEAFKYHSVGSAQEYLDAANIMDNLFRVGFHWPNGRGGDPVGHVFPLVHEHSDESYGGHGPGERPVTHQWFVDHADCIVILGPLVPAAQWTNTNLNPYLIG
jgi:hypothetical protein